MNFLLELCFNYSHEWPQLDQKINCMRKRQQRMITPGIEANQDTI